jgi:transketolase
MLNQINTEHFASKIRAKCLNMVHNANASHIGSALSIADIVAVLYGAIMNIDPKFPKEADRDRFILSKGHACTAIYAALAELGFFNESQLLTFGKDHSTFMTHISHKVPGVEFSTGSLGHGLPFGLGKALAAQKLKHKWKTFVVLGDGEIAEGSNWEAALFAAHHKLDNLVVIVDCNNLQSLKSVEKTLNIEPLFDKFSSFGWACKEIDGHNHDELLLSLRSTPWEAGKPSFLIARTIKGKGVSFMENSVDWHYKSPNKEQLIDALNELKAHLHA